jgi:hypothetical protein
MPRLTLKPRVVAPGARLAFIGAGFAPARRSGSATVRPRARPASGQSIPVSRAGAFRKNVHGQPSRQPSHWIAIAYQRGCPIKAGAGFRTVSGYG